MSGYSVEFAYVPLGYLTLKEVREIYNLTQAAAAEILGCMQPNISKLDDKLVRMGRLIILSKYHGHTAHVSLVG
jgi:predicted XRE-type DNA-binding protein